MTKPEIVALLAVAEAAQDLESLLYKRPDYDWMVTSQRRKLREALTRWHAVREPKQTDFRPWHSKIMNGGKE